MISFNCPACGKPLQVPPEFGGRQSKCPGCQGQITVPQVLRPANAPVQPAYRDAPAMGAPPPMQKQGMSTTVILLLVGGGLLGMCLICGVVGLASITLIGEPAKQEFKTVGSSLSAPPRK